MRSIRVSLARFVFIILTDERVCQPILSQNHVPDAMAQSSESDSDVSRGRWGSSPSVRVPTPYGGWTLVPAPESSCQHMDDTKMSGTRKR